jgi:Protein of unknown function (DUF1592)/Protein of unknown function (DUF1588)/Protein of unknown function (DUF1595)/Protein of unknown function (DUF1587)/Protein of unknown function (DUF1585)
MTLQATSATTRSAGYPRRKGGAARSCGLVLGLALEAVTLATGCGSYGEPGVGDGANATVSAAPSVSPLTASTAIAPEPATELAQPSSPTTASAPVPSLEPPSPTASVPAGPLAVPSEGRLLTRVQYDASVRDLFKGLVHGPFTAGFPTENEVAGFATDARSHQASSWLVEAHLLASEAVAAQVVAELPTLLPCSVAGRDRACAHAFVEEYSARAFRREVTAEELAPLRALVDEAFDTLDFDHAIGMSVESLLQSPQFLYRMEYAGELAAPGIYRVSDSEMASRLSYFFWNSIPDDTLIERARSLQLHDPRDIEEEARRLAADPRAQATLRDFTSQWLGIRKVDSIARQTPLGTGKELNSAWKASLSEFAVQSLWGPDGGVKNLLLSPRVFLTEEMAEIYGAPVPAGTPSDALFAADFSGQRFGLLTQPGLMALLAHADQTAPSQRGVFVREHILCQPPPQPPPEVNATPPDPDPNLTTRARFLVHTQQSECAGCHRMFDGIGLAFEGFDQAGVYRSEENGLPVDMSGEVYGTYDKSIAGDFVGPEELAQRLAGSYQVRDCLVTEWYRYSMGRFDETVDLAGVKAVAASAEAAGGGFAEIMIHMALSDAFRFRTEVAVKEELFR